MTATDNPRMALVRAFGQIDMAQRATVAAQAGVTPRQVANLIHGRPISVDSFLRLCAVAGHDPAPELPGRAGTALFGDLDRERFAVMLVMTRGLKGHTERDAADAAGISKTTVHRIEHGHKISVGVFVRICRYVNSHPFAWMKPNLVPVPVSHETKVPTAVERGLAAVA